MKNKALIPGIICMMLLISCRHIDVFEKNVVIPSGAWHHNFQVTGTFNIPDTVAAYNIFILLRHTDAYKYNNIWLDMGLQVPGDSMFHQKVELSLGDDASGWEGSGMNDIWEVRKLLNGAPKRFKKSGEYKYSIAQVMRDEPLNNIISAGLRVQRSEKAHSSN